MYQLFPSMSNEKSLPLKRRVGDTCEKYMNLFLFDTTASYSGGISTNIIIFYEKGKKEIQYNLKEGIQFIL